MNLELVLSHSLLYGGILSVFLGAMVILTLAWNREIWLHDFPPDVQAAYGPPRRPETKRQKTIAVALFFGGLLGISALSLATLAQRLGGLSFAAVFVNLLVMFMLFNLVDLVILDWLILGVLWRDLGYLPGTDRNLPGYKQIWGLAFQGFLKGSAGILVASAVLGAVVSGAWALLA